MALYAIGDLHLHFRTELKANLEMKDHVWRKHEDVFRKNCEALLQPDDTLVLTGDNSFGKNLTECEADLQYISALPGRKILLRGNHDHYWDAKKTPALNQQFCGKLSFLQNNFFTYDDYALVGTKGHCFEGPFYLDRKGRILGWNEKNEEQSRKLVEREIGRLEEYRVEQVIYSHSHGEVRFHDSIQGEYHGTLYSLVSGDYLKWKPKRIL